MTVHASDVANLRERQWRDLPTMIDAARLECERRMTELAHDRAGNERKGGELPREWFALHTLSRDLTRAFHAAEQHERRVVRA